MALIGSILGAGGGGGGADLTGSGAFLANGVPQSKQNFAAALDVTDPEPLPRDHPLLKLENVIVTPHLGSATEETRRRMAELSVENLFAGLEGKPLPYRVA